MSQHLIQHQVQHRTQQREQHQALFSLADKVALITGAANGIGRAIAWQMAHAGAYVLLSDIDSAGGSALAAEMTAAGYAVAIFPCDMGSRSEIQTLSSEALAAFGEIDILVCNAGVAPHAGPIASASDRDYELTMEINLHSNLQLCNLLIPQMAARNNGSVIIMSSIAGVRGNKNIGLYGLSKAASAQLVRNLAVEWGPSNVSINSISPGVIDTAFAKPISAQQELAAKRIALTPLRRFGQVDDVAGVAVFLASPAAAFMTGQNLIVDGGTTIGDGN
ncbi:SDR family oxidoreductase [Undibacterium sp. RTI2.1]|uniref:SDR family NAD(P)-dependent oxidoreductase n=2 Tax=Undibacterium TaxID=401469 RepID=UPI002AB4DAC1|nr:MULTISPECIES: SDR family oxidoreductase [unclassified Undibacterium]MDY7540145.1 SDR family oxidoreductase [Undibacterium sp. 5I1]MEB0030318.1 SDR family oxidoreductase [Undibacterium sp. RTI2.1]MEB0115402.1 SDR family oxidoreductase [Undibacterium sp. RTI2.2]MEB0230608.1 SDR family oxidoreductase [Undibacterium sp. 10I3]MEB0257072.1 SDR family oxidoreductase [Undibacterium sp. 5I1]